MKYIVAVVFGRRNTAVYRYDECCPIISVANIHVFLHAGTGLYIYNTPNIRSSRLRRLEGSMPAAWCTVICLANDENGHCDQ